MIKNNLVNFCICSFLVISLSVTAFFLSDKVYSDTSEFMIYRSNLNVVARNYIAALEQITANNFETARLQLTEVQGEILASDYKDEGYFPVLNEKADFYIKIIDNYDSLSAILSKLYEAQEFRNENDYIEALNIYTGMISQAQSDNPFTGLDNLELSPAQDFDRYIAERVNREVIDLNRMINRSSESKIELFIAPFVNESSDNSIDWMAGSMPASVGSVLERFELFQPYSAYDFDMNSQNPSENEILQIMRSNNLSIVIKGEYDIAGNGQLNISFQAFDTDNDNLFLNVAISGSAGFEIFSLFDNIGEKLAFALEMYNPDTFTEATFIGEDENDQNAPAFSQAGYQPYLNSLKLETKKEGTLFHLNAAVEVPSDDTFNAIFEAVGHINLVMDDLEVEMNEIEDWADDEYSAALLFIENLILLETGITWEQLQQMKDENEYRAALIDVENAIDDINELMEENPELSSAADQIDSLLAKLNAEQTELDGLLRQDWAQLGYIANLSFGYAFPATGYYDTLDPLENFADNATPNEIPYLNAGFHVRMPFISNYHMLFTVGAEIGFHQAEYDVPVLINDEYLTSNFIPLTLNATFMYEPFWNFWIGGRLSGGMDFIVNKTNIDDKIDIIEAANPFVMSAFSVSILAEYQVMNNLNIILDIKLAMVAAVGELSLFAAPVIGVSYWFM